jgi:hypothetical protein
MVHLEGLVLCVIGLNHWNLELSTLAVLMVWYGYIVFFSPWMITTCLVLFSSKDVHFIVQLLSTVHIFLFIIINLTVEHPFAPPPPLYCLTPHGTPSLLG